PRLSGPHGNQSRPQDPECASRPGPEIPQRVSLPALDRLTKRSEFLSAARGKRVAMPGFILQARQNHASNQMRVGFTCSQKVGNAVARNRAKRRLRALAQHILPEQGQIGFDYVLIGRAKVTAGQPFVDLAHDLRAALTKLHTNDAR
ncbi:MAG: ribonuclease P protein component, partial [Pseudomonadota bacterium]